MTESDDADKRAEALAARVTIVIERALTREYAAVKTMLDGPVDYQVPGRGAARAFVLGEIPAKGAGTHVVALHLGDQGNPTAAARATLAMERFQSSELLIMVGIAGGVPHPVKPEAHVRLGDLVVSGEGGVVYWDDCLRG